ncbi:hypothetical protein J8TS2_16120 [Lederbergia ruris]|uniref:Uncharacterized protein n=1 Tax=Lederbergia ruris TaxID=217495 RepID=A0ABQ4KH50_9BACI|nr:hypothetical protein J8TS2_16120 [Lederbergia ruris]
MNTLMIWLRKERRLYQNIILNSNSVKANENGYIVTKPGTTETNIPEVFACGESPGYICRGLILI